MRLESKANQNIRISTGNFMRNKDSGREEEGEFKHFPQVRPGIYPCFERELKILPLGRAAVIDGMENEGGSLQHLSDLADQQVQLENSCI